MKDSPHQLTPWFPDEAARRVLREKAELVSRESLELAAAAHPDVLDVLRELTRAMNSYYSNKIEGQGTHPLSIQRALEQDFSSSPDIARRQRLAVAHIEAERELERRNQSAGEVQQGLGERNARYLISALVKEGIVKSRGSHAPLAFNLPLRHLHFLMPNLYPEANTDNLEEG